MLRLAKRIFKTAIDRVQKTIAIVEKEWRVKKTRKIARQLESTSWKRFCYAWAKTSSREFEFEERHATVWKFPWRVEFYDLHRWNGYHIHWNGWDVESGEGTTLEEAWEDMAKKIFLYEEATSREGAIIKAELAMRKDLPRGWGRIEWCKHYGLPTSAAHQQGEKT